MKHFWEKLERPILALAPLHDVTDTAFRQVVARCGKPSVMFTEFVSVDGLSHEKSQERLIRRYLQFDAIERPGVAQIWGTDPEKFRVAAELIRKLGFDGIDINMGCPEKTVLKSGACAALADDPQRAQDIVRATKEGAGELPVSIKTRLGNMRDVMETWIPQLLETQPAALTLHGRTAKEMSRVPAHWDRIALAAQMVHEAGIPILGNGDVRSYDDALDKVRTYGVDGVMVGRGIFGNFWFFNRERSGEDIPLAERLRTFVEHADLFEKHFAGMRSVITLRKHVRGLAQGFAGAKELREQLVQETTAAGIRRVVEDYLALNEKTPTGRA